LLLKAPCLQPGDTVGLMSPSSPAAALYPHRLQQGVHSLRAMGLGVRLAPGINRRTRWTAGSPAERANDLHELWADSEVKAIIATIGGDHANQVLPFLDTAFMARQPKVLLGYSDVTVLLLALHVRTNLVTFYGPAVLPEFGEPAGLMPYTFEYLHRAVFSVAPVGLIRPTTTWTDEFRDWDEARKKPRSRKLACNAGWRWLRPGRAKGQLLGGCLQSLMHLRGTQYWPNWNGALLFWEPSDSDSSPGHIDSMLTDLDNSGVFAAISGMIVGRLCRYSEEQRATLDEVILERTSHLDFPILVDVDFGHTDPKITLPIGVAARLDSAADSFEIVQSGVIARAGAGKAVRELK